MHEYLYYQRFNKLQDISPNVADYLSRELFKEEFSDSEDFTSKDILQACYRIILNELEDFGLFLIADRHDTLCDLYQCERITVLRSLVDTDKLSDYLNNEQIQKGVENLHANSVQREEALPDYLESLFIILEEAYPASEDLFHIEEIRHLFMAKGAFQMHVEAILDRVKYADFQTVDYEAMVKYTHKIQTLRDLAERTVNQILINLPSGVIIDRAKVRKLLSDYDRDKLGEIETYMILDRDIVPVYLKDRKKEVMVRHHERSPHHLEYWLAPKNNEVPLTKENLILLVAHHCEPGADHTTFIHAVETMLEKGRTVFTPEDIEFIQFISSKVNLFVDAVDR